MLIIAVLGWLCLVFVQSQTAFADNPLIFNPATSNGMHFDGQPDSRITIPNKNGVFNFGSGDFTIAWWQSVPTQPDYWQRVFQLDDGQANSSAFSVSQENDGNIYFWLNQNMIAAAPMTRNGPTWTHYAIVRDSGTIYIYQNGIPLTGNQASAGTPEDLSLVIGGNWTAQSGAMSGSFDGSITGFEVVKGVEWSSNFTPPTDYSQTVANRVLLLFPTSSFTSSTLADLTGTFAVGEITTQGVTYIADSDAGTGGDSGGQTVTYSHYIANVVGGHGSISPNGAVTTPNTVGVDFTITPNNGYQVDTISLNGSSQDIESSNLWFPSDINKLRGAGILRFGAGFPSGITVEVTFSPDPNFTLLRISKELIGDADIYDDLTTSDPMEDVLVSPGDTYHLEIEQNGAFYLKEIIVNVESLDLTNSEIWNPDTEILTLTNVQNNLQIIILTTAVAAFPSKADIDYIDIYRNSGFTATGDGGTNNYNYVNSIELELNYLSPGLAKPIPRQCRLTNTEELEAFSWQVREDNSNLLDLRIPDLDLLEEACPSFDLSNFDLGSPTLIAKFLSGFEDHYYEYGRLTLRIKVPPSIERIIGSTEIEFGQSRLFELKNTSHIFEVGFSLIGSEFIDNECFFSYPITEMLGLDQAFKNTDGYYNVTFPTLEAFNFRCRSEEFFVDLDHQEVDLTSSHLFRIWFTDIDGDSLESLELSIIALSLDSTPEITPPTPEITPPTPEITPPTPEITPPTPVINPIYSDASNMPEELKPPITEGSVPYKPTENIEFDQSKPVDIPINIISTWCKKPGIWIYTLSGKLRMCNPAQQTALEIKACTGRVNTPTYPWIYKPQRFASTLKNTKSGISLYYAVFFFKGLAISGANEVADHPCSRGSVFIPKQYAKQVYDFAKMYRPTIWVKNS